MIRDLLELRKVTRNRKLSRDELAALQNQKLRAMVQHAYQSVPYYRSLLDSQGITAGDIRTVADLEHLPVTTKDDLRAAGLRNIISKGVNPSSCFSTVTSGSTGKPFTIYLTRSDLRTHRAIAFRSLRSMGFSPRDRIAILGITHPKRTRFYQYLGMYRSINIHPLLPIDEQIRLLKEMNPTIFWAYPTALRSFYHQTDSSLHEFIRPRMMISGAEVLDPALGDRVRTDLNVKYF